MRQLTLKQASQITEIDEVVIHSLEGGLYIAQAIHQGHCYRLMQDAKQALKSHSIAEIKRALYGLHICHLSLRHASAYDEMLGLPLREEGNELSVMLSLPADDITVGCLQL